MLLGGSIWGLFFNLKICIGNFSNCSSFSTVTMCGWFMKRQKERVGPSCWVNGVPFGVGKKKGGLSGLPCGRGHPKAVLFGVRVPHARGKAGLSSACSEKPHALHRKHRNTRWEGLEVQPPITTGPSKNLYRPLSKTPLETSALPVRRRGRIWASQ